MKTIISKSTETTLSGMLTNESIQGLISRTTIERYLYSPYSIKKAIEVVNEIGRFYNYNFKIDDGNRFLYENLIRWVHGDVDFVCTDYLTQKPTQGNLKKGIYVSGEIGTGKTLALIVMAVYTEIDKVKFYQDGKEHRLRWEVISADSICEQYEKTGDIEVFKKMPVLCIDDLGSETTENLYMGNRRNVLKSILEYRFDVNKLTLITSNLPFDSKLLQNAYGDRVVSRLRGMCNYFELRGKDRRKL